MDHYKRVLTVQDISCVGQVSAAAALPVLSACGAEACVLPSAVLSNHTWKGFGGASFRDLTDGIPAIEEQWERAGIRFDALLTGYLGNEKQIGIAEDLMRRFLNPGALKVVDPVMGDGGALYTGFDASYVRRMAGLCSHADLLLPNLTEACFLTGTEYRPERQTEAYAEELLKRLSALGAGRIVLKGISFDGKTIGNGVYDRETGETQWHFTERIPRQCFGTGDLFAAALTGALLQGRPLPDAAALAADFVLESIRATGDDPDHRYGVKFEKALWRLTDRLNRPEEKIYRYVIDGAAFSDREGFFTEIERLMTDVSWKTGRNLAAFNDILRGGFGKHPYGAPVEILWKNFDESREALGDDFLLTVIRIILDQENNCTLKIME